MLNNIIKVSFSIVGAFTGFTLVKIFIYENAVLGSEGFAIAIYAGVMLIIAFVFYSTANRVIDMVANFLDRAEHIIQNLTLYELALSSIGLIVGLIVANLITIPLNKVSVIGIPISIMINIVFACTGIYIASGKKHESVFESFKNARLKGLGTVPSTKVVDTSALIDGRIADILQTGFLEGELIIPGFVLKELQHIADSSDMLKRNRGRRGLDVINIIQKELGYPVKIENIEIEDGADVDSELLKTAKKLGATVITTDYNLNKVASIQGVEVLNVNNLANAVKPIALPGEEMMIQVIKDGKENGQGIGYLDDGTMIVVEGGKKYMGENINVLVTSVLQTAAGRMIFAKPKLTVERVTL